MPALLSSRAAERANRNAATISDEDIQNDIILRESAYIADQLLKRLAPAQPVFHHTELMPIRQNRAEAPTAQIISPKASQHAMIGIQKPPPPQLASMRSKMHFTNNLPIPQLKDAKYLRRKAAMPNDGAPNPDDLKVQGRFSTDSHFAGEQIPQPRAPYDKVDASRNMRSGIQKEPDCFRPSREHIPTSGPFPSQRLAPPIPSKISATAQAIGVYGEYKDQNYSRANMKQSGLRRDRHEESGTAAAQSQREKKAPSVTGKRRPGQGVMGHVTVPVIGPPPAERRWRYQSRKAVKNGNDAGHREFSMQRRDSEPGWEEVPVRGGGQDDGQNCGYGGVSRAYTT